MPTLRDHMSNHQDSVHHLVQSSLNWTLYTAQFIKQTALNALYAHYTYYKHCFWVALFTIAPDVSRAMVITPPIRDVTKNITEQTRTIVSARSATGLEY